MLSREYQTAYENAQRDIRLQLQENPERPLTRIDIADAVAFGTLAANNALSRNAQSFR